LRAAAGEALDFAAHATGHFAEEMFHQQGDIALTFAKRWEVDGDDVESIVEVFAKLSIGNVFLQVGVGGGDESNVDGHFVVGTESSDFAVFEDAKEFDLRVHRHFADFVKEQGATIGVFEFTDAASDGTGEGTGFVAKKFTFEDTVGQR
jgi:hypothetical protein